MGTMFYGTSEQAIEVDDALLEHVQKVTLTKLRRGESFSMSWKDDDGRRETVWVHAALMLRFAIEEESGRLDGDLLRHLMDSANSNRGMDLSDGFVEQRRRAVQPTLRAA